MNATIILPKRLAHLQADIERLPHPAMLADIVAECARNRIQQREFESLLRATADLYESPAQRCAACLSWSSQFHAAVIGSSDHPVLVAMCPGCFERMTAGRPTRAMQRNLRAYAGGGR